MSERYCRCRDRYGSRFNDALDIQDGCNLRAIARALVRAVDEASDQGTAASYCDAAVVLIVNKIESLVRSDERFSQAYDECRTRTCRPDPNQR